MKKCKCCDKAYIEWCDEGCEFKSKIVPVPDKHKLIKLLNERVRQTQDILNSKSSITFDAPFIVGIDNTNCCSSLIVINIIPTGQTVTYVGTKEIVDYTVISLSELKRDLPNGQVKVEYKYRIISNDLIDITYITTIFDPTRPTTVRSILKGQWHIVNCGRSLPILDWATSTTKVVEEE